MPAKTLEVALKLNLGNMRAGLGAAAGDVKAFGKSLNEAIPEHHQTKLDKLGSGALVMGGAMLAGFGLAAKAAMDFDKQLSELQAVSGASGDALEALRQQAIDAGAATVFSAGEAAQAQTELAKAGVSTADILGGALTGSLNLASAGSLDLATAAEIAAQTMTTFGLKGSDVGRIADALAAGANKSAADVEQLAQGLQQSGLVANQFGLTMEETVGTLSLFSQNALNGSDAGTSLKTMLLRLGAPTAEVKDTMKELGISMYDSSGGARDLADVADNLQTALGGMSEEQRNAALTTIFGSDAIRAANILYKAGGDGVREWTKAVTDSGYAADLAAQKNDNLAGDLESLQGTFETALITTGEKSQGALRGLVQGLNDLINGFLAMSSAGQNTVLIIAGVGAAALVIFGAIVKLNGAMQSLGISMSLGPQALIFVAVAAAVGIFAKSMIESGRAAQEAKGRVDAYVQSAGDVSKALAAQKFAASDSAKFITEAGLSFDQFRQAIADTDQPFKKFLDNTGTFFDHMSSDPSGRREFFGAWKEFKGDLDAAAKSGDAFAQSLKAMVDAGQISDAQANAIAVSVAQQAEAQQEANRQTDIANSIDPTSAEGKKKVADSARQAADELNKMADAVDKLIDKEFSEQEATTALHRQMNSTVEDAKAFVEAGGKMADVMTSTSDEALSLQDDLAALAKSNGDLIQGWIQAGMGSAELADRVAFLAKGMYDFAIAQGFPEAEAARLRDTLLSIPAEVQSQVGTPGAVGATGEVSGLHGWLSSLPKSVSTPVSAPGADNLLGTIADLKARLDRLGGSSAHPEIQALIDQGSFNQANAALNSLARTRMANIITNVGRSVGNWLHMDGGGIIAAAARGLEVGPHSAELAGPGAVRWREPDTQGEGYVPFANDWRRSGAQKVWTQIGHRIGMLNPAPGPRSIPQPWASSPGPGGGGNHYSFVMPVSVSVPNYVGDQTEFNRAVVSAVKSSEPTMKAALADAVRRTGR